MTALTQSGPSQKPSPLPLVRVGRFVIEGVLGSGGMAVVYLARDPALDRSIALKVIQADSDAHATSRLVREAQALARVVHPNVIHVYEVGRETEQLVYIAMERVTGITLAEWLRTPRSRRAILDVFAAAGRGLAAAHAAGLVHRDFKPENVMIGDDGRVRVLDFGLARGTESDAMTDDIDKTPTSAFGRTERGAILATTEIGSVLGTPAYMSPEQWRGERPTPRSDQFAFCVALALALAGEHPFALPLGTAETEGKLDAREHLRTAVLAGTAKPLPRSVPSHLRTTLRRGLALEPSERFASMAQLLAAIERRARWPFAIAGLVVVSIAVAFALLRSPATGSSVTAYASPRPLTSRGDIGGAAVSPDGTQLAILTPTSLVVQPLAGAGEARELLHGRVGYFSLAWSPDGARLAVLASVDQSDPGVFIVDVASGRARRVAENLGHLVLLSGDTLAAAHWSDTELAFYSLADLRTPRRSCALPQPFIGVRSVRRDLAGDAVLVQVDINDSETTVFRIDQNCRVEPAIQRLASLAFVERAGDHRLLAALLSRNDLVEIDGAGKPNARRHVIQSSSYEPLAALTTGRIVHLDRSTHWQLVDDRAHREVLGGTGESRFAIAPDNVMVAQVDGAHHRGLLRIGRLDALSPALPVIATDVVRVAWSPDGNRLAILIHRDATYELALWDRTTRTQSAPRQIPIHYDVEMAWIDDHRVAFSVPHEYKGFRWVDVNDGSTGKLDVGNGEQTLSLVRAHRGGMLAFVTETEREIRAWAFRDGESPRLIAAIPVTTPKSARKARVRWAADDTALLVFAGHTGEVWSAHLAGNTVERLPDLPLPHAGAFAEVTDVIALPDQLLVETVVQSADVYVSTPLDN